jgi:hypothetical protein
MPRLQQRSYLLSISLCQASCNSGYSWISFHGLARYRCWSSSFDKLVNARPIGFQASTAVSPLSWKQSCVHYLVENILTLNDCFQLLKRFISCPNSVKPVLWATFLGARGFTIVSCQEGNVKVSNSDPSFGETREKSCNSCSIVRASFHCYFTNAGIARHQE